MNLQILATIKIMEFLEPICNNGSHDESLISQLFRWIDISNDNDKFNIDIEDAFNIILIVTSDFKNIDDVEIFLIENFYPYKRLQTKIFIDWKTMVEMALNNTEANIKKRRQISKYLLSIQDIYEDIIKKIQNHFNECLKSSHEMNKLLEDHIILKQKEHYEPIITKLETKYKSAKKELSILYKKINSQNNHIKKLCESIQNKATNKKETKLLQTINEGIADLNKIYEQNIGKYITPRKIIGKSIITELDNFPIIYTGSAHHFLPIEDFEGICRSYSIPDTNIKILYKSLLPPFADVSNKTKIIPMVIDITSIDDIQQKFISDVFDFNMDEVDFDTVEEINDFIEER